MAAFDQDRDGHRPDYHLLTKSPIARVGTAEVLANLTGWLQDEGYHLIEVQASWLISAHMIRDLTAMSQNDCSSDGCWQCLSGSVGGILFDAPAGATGVVLVLKDFGVYAGHRYGDAMTLLDIVASCAWRALSLGRRVLCLAHVEQADIPLPRPGPFIAGSAEWAWQDHVARLKR
ncbi:hypothetical protein Rhe02_14210 [Rhizocola hellebori]|uniref:Uncharacterized protein n=1 Tax=Rhizocola hellebori TaxID=1392758 RepID=A0A8J3VD92_9ACTN|nr:hypothetical protein [Rhizocola hellebori]GIH03354.1 hypothetical protein Rhe02_14210 [Rhizocola hellebori]